MGAFLAAWLLGLTRAGSRWAVRRGFYALCACRTASSASRGSS